MKNFTIGIYYSLMLSQITVITTTRAVALPTKQFEYQDVAEKSGTDGSSSLWKWGMDYLFEKDQPAFNGFITIGYKPVFWWNERLDDSVANTSLNNSLGGFSVVEFGVQTSKGWMLRLALPDEDELRENIEYLKLFFQTDRLFIGVETGGFKGQLRYGADNYKFGTLGGEDPIYSTPTIMEFNSGYRRVNFGYFATKGLRLEAYYYAYNKPYFYNIEGDLPRAFEALDSRSSYSGYFLGAIIDTYNLVLRSRPGKINKVYQIIRLGFGYGQTSLSQSFVDEINFLTNEEFSKDMSFQIVLNESAELGYMIGHVDKDGLGYALSCGAFIDMDMPFGIAEQKSGNLRVETSNTYMGSNIDFFYGVVFRASLTW